MDNLAIIARLTHDPGPYYSPDVIRLAGCTYRQLDYLIAQGIVTPSVQLVDVGSGKRREFDRHAVLEVIVARKFADAGIDVGNLKGVDEVIPYAQNLMRSLIDIIRLVDTLDSELDPEPAA